LAEGGGYDHVTGSVEFKKEDTTGMHHATREIQRLSIEHSGVTEEWELIIEQDGDQLDEGTFEVSFLQPENGNTYFTKDIKVNPNRNSEENHM